MIVQLRAGQSFDWQEYYFPTIRGKDLREVRKAWEEIPKDVFSTFSPSRDTALALLRKHGIEPKSGFDSLILSSAVTSNPKNIKIREG